MTTLEWLAAAIGAALIAWGIWGLLRPYSPDDRKNWEGPHDE